MPRALLSVSDKTGLAEFAGRLAALGWELVASGGTAAELQRAGLTCVPVEKVTGNPEAFGGRMKTISFQLEGGILFDRSDPAHVEQARQLGVEPVDMVVCNFYPFHQAVAEERDLSRAVELIDVGGPTMVRAAAKNFHSVAVVTHPDQYQTVVAELEAGGISLETRRRLAWAAFQALSQYDLAVAGYLAREDTALRYGENPHQRGWFLPQSWEDPLRHLQGKQLSYNNYLDLDGALLMLSHLGSDPACVIVKHANPCGVATADTVEEAFERAWDGDAVAAFGGIVATNQIATASLACAIVDRGHFVEVLAAPRATADALDILKQRKNLQVVVHPSLAALKVPQGGEGRAVRGGLLLQDVDSRRLCADDLSAVTQATPTPSQVVDMLLAWHVCKVTRSNAIAIVRDGMLVGSGAGQQDRLRCCRLAVSKAGERAQGAVAASDGFFPFADGPQALIEAGVKAIVQPGGSIRDAETIEACDRAGIVMCFTGVRCFKH